MLAYIQQAQFPMFGLFGHAPILASLNKGTTILGPWLQIDEPAVLHQTSEYGRCPMLPLVLARCAGRSLVLGL